MEKMDRTNFLGGKQASNLLGVHQRTLYLWERKGVIDAIRTPGGKRLYNVTKYLENQGLKCKNIKKDEIKCTNLKDINENERVKICYARVSSIGQKEDLERQKQEMINLYPNNILIEDIGSGINMMRRGLLKIIELGINGQIDELVIAHKDRLTRFGYELIEYIIKKYSNGTIIINKKNEIEPEEEMVKDVLQIMNVFVAKMNGRRKYKNRDRGL
jgi:putative resolvase